MTVAVDALRVLSTRHLQAVRSAREFHLLIREGRNVLDDGRPPSDKIRGPWQYLHGRDATGERGCEAGVLGPDGMLCPDVGSHRVGHLVGVVETLRVRGGCNTEVRVDIDEARCD